MLSDRLSQIRRIWIGLNPFPQPSSGQDGWAHYAEEMMWEEGLGSGDPDVHIGQLSNALKRNARWPKRASPRTRCNARSWRT